MSSNWTEGDEKSQPKRKEGEERKGGDRKYCKITQNGDWKTLHIRTKKNR